MYVVLLRFSSNKANAAEHMEGHNAWIARGFSDGVFLLVGSLAAKQGGAIVAHGATREELEVRVNEDPFVEARVVEAEILEIAAAKADPRLEFLVD